MDSSTNYLNLPPQLVSVMTEGGWGPMSTDGPGQYRTKCSSDLLRTPLASHAELGPNLTFTATENERTTPEREIMDKSLNFDFTRGQERSPQHASQDPIVEIVAMKPKSLNEDSYSDQNIATTVETTKPTEISPLASVRNKPQRNLNSPDIVNTLEPMELEEIETNNSSPIETENRPPIKTNLKTRNKKNKYVPLTMEKMFAPLTWSRYISINFPEKTTISGLQTDKFLRNYMQVPLPYFKIDRNQITATEHWSWKYFLDRYSGITKLNFLRYFVLEEFNSGKF